MRAPELQTENVRKEQYEQHRPCHFDEVRGSYLRPGDSSADLIWEMISSKPTIRNISLDVLLDEKETICGVGSGHQASQHC